jgi:antitoxin component of MazEF toxin-antitoxin module
MKKHILRIIKIGNSIGVILPRKTYEFKDLEVGDWIECKEVRKIR